MGRGHIQMKENKCHICDGKGYFVIKSMHKKSTCYYCNGTGKRNRKYKRNAEK